MKTSSLLSAGSFLLLAFSSETAASTPVCDSALQIFINNSHQGGYPWMAHSSADCNMGQGAKGDGVLSVQLAFNNCYASKLGVAKLSTDKDFGPKTEAAVVKMQGYIGGLAKDGIWGPKTGHAMKWWSVVESTGKWECSGWS
jgi:hypothetical protein